MKLTSDTILITRGASGIIMKINQIYLSMISGFIISLIAFLLFQIFPEQIISLFGTGSAEYYDFSDSKYRESAPTLTTGKATESDF